MKHGSRALRRHHLLRIKAKWRARLAERTLPPDPAELARRVGLHAGTARVCSCWMCGNPRRYWAEPSLGERRECELERRVGDS